MAVFIFPENFPLRHVKSVAEPAPCPHFQIIEVEEDAIKCDEKYGNLQKCVATESFHVVPVPLKGGRAKIMRRGTTSAHTYSSDFLEVEESDTGVTKNIQLCKWFPKRAGKLTVRQSIL